MGVITPFILCIIGLVILYIYFVSPNWIPDFYAILFEKNVDDIIDDCNTNSLILDIGCGNSKNMNYRDDCNYIGVDICENFINQNKSKNNCNYIIADCVNIPLQSNSIDYILSIAVIHHLSTYERRYKAIEEIYRLLKINGKALIYVWAFEQPKFKSEKTKDEFLEDIEDLGFERKDANLLLNKGTNKITSDEKKKIIRQLVEKEREANKKTETNLRK